MLWQRDPKEPRSYRISGAVRVSLHPRLRLDRQQAEHNRRELLDLMDVKLLAAMKRHNAPRRAKIGDLTRQMLLKIYSVKHVSSTVSQDVHGIRSDIDLQLLESLQQNGFKADEEF